MQLSDIITKHDLERFRVKLIEDIKQHFSSSNPEMKEYLSTREICDLLDISQSTLRNWAIRGIVAPIKMGGKNFYKYTDIKDSLKGSDL